MWVYEVMRERYFEVLGGGVVDLAPVWFSLRWAVAGLDGGWCGLDCSTEMEVPGAFGGEVEGSRVDSEFERNIELYVSISKSWIQNTT